MGPTSTPRAYRPSAHAVTQACRDKQLQTSEHYVMLGQDDLVDGLSGLKKKARGE
jgi:hypothetical protein